MSPRNLTTITSGNLSTKSLLELVEAMKKRGSPPTSRKGEHRNLHRKINRVVHINYSRLYRQQQGGGVQIRGPLGKPQNVPKRGSPSKKRGNRYGGANFNGGQGRLEVKPTRGQQRLLSFQSYRAGEVAERKKYGNWEKVQRTTAK